MDRIDIPTGSLEAEFLDNLSEAVSGEVSGSQVDRIIGKATTLLDIYREAVKNEMWDAWVIAQNLSRDEERDALYEEQRILEAQTSHFHGRRHAFNQWVTTYHKHRHEDHPEGSDQRKQLDAMAEEATADEGCCGHNHDDKEHED